MCDILWCINSTFWCWMRALLCRDNRELTACMCNFRRVCLGGLRLNLDGLELLIWWRGTVIERRSLTGELSLSCAPSPSHLFLHPPRLPRLIHHFVHLWLHLSFTPGLKPTSFTNPTPLVSFLPPGLPPRTIACTVSSELLRFLIIFFFIIFRFWAVR